MPVVHFSVRMTMQSTFRSDYGLFRPIYTTKTSKFCACSAHSFLPVDTQHFGTPPKIYKYLRPWGGVHTLQIRT